MRTRSLRLVLSTLGVAVLLSCSSTSEGSPKPAPTSDTDTEPVPTSPSSDPTSQGEVDLPYAGAPKVENALDTVKFQQDPCQILTAAQAQELNVESPGHKRDAALGMECRYPSKSDVSAYVAVSFFEDHPHGLSSVYEANNDGDLGFFEELDPIEGYPAVSWGSDDLRAEGRCRIGVGVADDLVFDTILELSQANVGKKDPCETAAMVAGMALQTMTAGR